MKKIINNSLAALALLIAVLGILVSCEDSFDSDGFETNVAVSIQSFTINGTAGEINQGTGAITVNLPYGSNVTSIMPQVVLPEGATTNLQMDAPLDFSAPVSFRVVNGNLYKDYTVTVVVAAPIVSFTINGVAATLNHANKTINLTLPAGTDLTALQPVIELSEGVSISPASGSTVNFSESVIFTVTAGSTAVEYTANVGVPVEGIVVAFLGTAGTRAEITNMDEVTAANWLFDNYGGAQYLSFEDVSNGADLSSIDVIWWHYDSATSLPPIAYTPAVVTALQGYRNNGGNLLLTTFASQYVDALGIVPAGKGPNNVFGDFLPAGFVDGNSWGMSFMGNEGHPIFQGLETYQTGKAHLLEGGTFRLNHTAWWFLPEWGGYNDGAGWRSQTGGTNLASEAWDDALNGRVTIAEWPADAEDKNVVVISMGAYDWYNEANAEGTPSQPNGFITNIHTLTQNSIDYLIGD